MDRRSFLRGAALGASALPFHALLARAQTAPKVKPPRGIDYGPLVPVADELTGLPLLMLPEGFRYVSFGWTGDIMSSGQRTPAAHDGMAAFKVSGGKGRVRVVRNHEVGGGTPFSTAAYDSTAAGGTTTFEFDVMTGQFIGSWDSLSGTLTNCAGGATPWGTWLTCEETNAFRNNLPHGYIFEVPIEGQGSPVPLRAMGRFSHEAIAMDPATGYVYETEDAGSSSGFYRFVPNVPGELTEGGALYMLKVAGVDLANLGAGYANGSTFDVEWVPIANPENPASTSPGNYVWSQGRAQGAATFARLEGAWYGNDGRIYFVSTNGGAVGQGQIWVYDPQDETVSLVFESPSSSVLNAPDNICVSPRGGLVLCEDGGGEEFLHGLTVDGTIFKFCKNNVVLNGEVNGITGNFTGSEFAGACFSPEGQWLFVNIQSPGITFAIHGPWRAGAL